METMKMGRRRTHDHDPDEPIQFKRKRKREIEPDNSDSVQIIGETHLVVDLKDDNDHLREPHEAPGTKRLLPNGVGGGIAGGLTIHGAVGRYPGPHGGRSKERPQMNGVTRTTEAEHTSIPSLPPNPRESDRMLFVQQWINNIPQDLPFWVQTSLTQIMPVTNPDCCYPTEEDRQSVTSTDRLTVEGKFATLYTCKPPSDRSCLSCHEARTVPDKDINVAASGTNAFSHSFDYSSAKSQHQHPSPRGPPTSSTTAVARANALRMLGTRYPYPTAGGGGSSVLVSTSTLIPSAVHPNEPHGHVPLPVATHNGKLDGLDAYRGSSFGMMVNCETGQQTQCSNDGPGIACQNTAPVGRLFDDAETQLVVKLFRDYFTKGSCPILSDVRRRVANTLLEGRRTATSIRAKIKRLQTSGRWTDYTGI
ncbi:hypothetical protein PHET_03831 [Paragonimus heterotremus]|uniref:Uncharacterized protein n=1 Tax=Paragonimus heterotremus TaxID=100268 RepID=A0A8J4TNC9_9TREM|nr:hypothetical protein PHET_03831 [Paragonimus heterotremus]